ncbi:hypothetical protein D8676_04315 [Mesorhizobium sp. YM1C-6-2]|nr:hypothetical protein D8676_04315 [Mesorhizobium sp. YM1C-6-2]
MGIQANAVRIERVDGMWTVFIVIDGETTQRTFESKEYAENFADGQRARLLMINDNARNKGSL